MKSSIQSKARRVVYDQIQTLLKSFIQSLSSLRQLFYRIRARAAIKNLETKIRDLYDVDGKKIQLSSFVLAKDTVHEEEAFQELCQTLQQAQEMKVELEDMINKEEERQKSYEWCYYLTNLLKRRLVSLQSNTRVSDDVEATLGSLKETIFYLQKFLRDSSFGGSRAEIQIRHFALKAKEDIETQFRNFCAAKEEHRLPKQASEQHFQTLHQLTENATQLLSTIRNTRSNEAAAEFEFSRCYPKLEEGGIMVGRQNDVSIIKNQLFSSFHGVNTLIVSGSDSESQLGAPALHLPSTIWESPQLRHLELGTSYAVNPPSMVKENLQTLSWVDPTHCRNRVYSNFPNIKILKIFYKVDLEASQISGSSSNCFILDELDYLGRLKSLTISVSVGCIVTLPERCIFPSQLKKLKLSGINLCGWDLIVIGRLQWLEVLKLENVFHEKVWEVAKRGFYRLRLLVLKDKKLERLEANTDSFPCLEHLVLRCCDCLEEIPSSFGEIFCFKSIEMDRFSHRPSIVASARDIQEKLNKNFGKENFEVRRKQL
nr:putative late blight resistance protein homolog R1A-10 [Ipomoea batatas]